VARNSSEKIKQAIKGYFREFVRSIKIRWTDYVQGAIEITLSGLIGFLVAGVILYVIGYDPLRVFNIMFSYGYMDLEYLMGKTTPLIMTGLAFSIPLLAGVFNIGGESQLYLGAITGLLTAYYTGNWLLAIIVGFIAGAAWGGLVAILRVYRGINEVITAIMLNWIAYYTIIYLILKYFSNPIYPQESIEVPVSAKLLAHDGFILGLVGVALIYYLLYYTDLGYKIRVSGLSPGSAKYAGFSPSKSIIYSMLIGGGMAGYGGALLILSVSYSIDVTMSTLYGIGFTGIGVGLLGRNHPIGIIFSAMFIAGLIIGGQWVELKTGAPPMLSDAITGTIIIALAAPYAYRVITRYLRYLRGGVSS
jgi:ABC-type uncharacterized transport system permease subunit